MLSCQRFLPLLLAIGLLAEAPFVKAQDKAIDTSVCEITKYPAAFDNKIVRIKATYAGNFEVSSIRDPHRKDCDGISFTYPGGHSLGVSLNLEPPPSRPAVQLKRDEQFHRFQRLMDAQMYPRRREYECTDCRRYEVTATMVGLVEFAEKELGFGHMNSFRVQFVLQSIEHTSVRDLAQITMLHNSP